MKTLALEICEKARPVNTGSQKHVSITVVSNDNACKVVNNKNLREISKKSPLLSD